MLLFQVLIIGLELCLVLMTNIPENATIVYVEDLDKYYIRVDKGAVSYVWETALNLEQII